MAEPDRHPPTMPPQQADARRPAAVRTAILVGLIAAAFYVGFILMGVTAA